MIKERERKKSKRWTDRDRKICALVTTPSAECLCVFFPNRLLTDKTNARQTFTSPRSIDTFGSAADALCLNIYTQYDGLSLKRPYIYIYI